MMKNSAGVLVDLFCGCGGFSLGAELAGFHTLAAIDVDPPLQSSYKRNFPTTRAIEADVRDILKSDWHQLIGKVRPDGVIGGPPCQGFSRIGKRAKNDPRNTLIHHFYRHVAELSPKFFVMENVEGLLDDGNRNVLDDAIAKVSGRYNIIGPLVVNAADFGAATNRRRAIVIGYDPSDCDPLTFEHIQPSLGRMVTVHDAISDLPGPINGDGTTEEFDWARYPEKTPKDLSHYARSLRKTPPDGLGWQEAVQLQKQGYITGLRATRHSEAVAKRYSEVEGGKVDSISKSYRLEWHGRCPTLRAGTGSEKGSFQAVRPLHPAEGRVITVREAARMQSFPDWFVFHPTKWHSFRMIGNSVSPIVSFGLLSNIKKTITHKLPEGYCCRKLSA